MPRSGVRLRYSAKTRAAESLGGVLLSFKVWTGGSVDRKKAMA